MSLEGDQAFLFSRLAEPSSPPLPHSSSFQLCISFHGCVTSSCEESHSKLLFDGSDGKKACA